MHIPPEKSPLFHAHHNRRVCNDFRHRTEAASGLISILSNQIEQTPFQM